MKNRVKVNYYDSFSCMADQCPYTCCQEWAISVDEETLEKWVNIKMETVGLGDAKKPDRTLCDCLEKEGAGHIILLDEDKMCPFLNEQKLCKLVAELGVEYSADICREYPRHINKFEDREEYSLDFGCPAVIDLLNKCEGEVQFVVEEVQEPNISLLDQVREMMLEIMQNEEYSLTACLMVTCHCLLEMLEGGEVTEESIETYTSREYLESLVSELEKLEFECIDSFWERNELFQDIIQLYRKGESYMDYVEEISMWAQRLEEWYSDIDIIEKNELFETQYIRFEKLLRNYLVAEIWASCLQAKSTLEDMIMVFQWITLEYCALKQAVFLKWLSREEEEVDYNLVKDYIMIISRMAGYDQSDIKNCMEYSFDKAILEWGYLALVLGNGKL